MGAGGGRFCGHRAGIVKRHRRAPADHTNASPSKKFDWKMSLPHVPTISDARADARACPSPPRSEVRGGPRPPLSLVFGNKNSERRRREDPHWVPGINHDSQHRHAWQAAAWVGPSTGPLEVTGGGSRLPRHTGSASRPLYLMNRIPASVGCVSIARIADGFALANRVVVRFPRLIRPGVEQRELPPYVPIEPAVPRERHAQHSGPTHQAGWVSRHPEPRSSTWRHGSG